MKRSTIIYGTVVAAALFDLFVTKKAYQSPRNAFLSGAGFVAGAWLGRTAQLEEQKDEDKRLTA